MIGLAAILLSSAMAQPYPQLDILMLPIGQRVERFRAEKKQAYPFLVQTAFDPKQTLAARWRAVTTMGRLDSQFFRNILERALGSKEWFMRNAALIALQNVERQTAVEWSARLLADPALVVRTQAVRNLIQLDARETENLLWNQIFASRNFHGPESLWVRVHMAEALAQFASPGHSKQFERLLLDSDERLHKWAILGLENTTGFKTSDRHLPLEIRRQQWLERLGQTAI